jgi:hypothetical protein
MIKHMTFLKIKEYYLYCVPSHISCRNGKLIVSLTPEEQLLFRQYENDLHKFHLTYITLENYVSFRISEKKKIQAKIIKISYSKMILYLDIDDATLTILTQLSLEFFRQEISFFVTGHISGVSDSQEVEGFRFLTVDLEYSFSLVDSLTPLYTYYDKINSQNSGE